MCVKLENIYIIEFLKIVKGLILSRKAVVCYFTEEIKI